MAAQRVVEIWQAGRLITVRSELSRESDEKCDGCQSSGGPCVGPLCSDCDRCDWECMCWGYEDA